MHQYIKLVHVNIKVKTNGSSQKAKGSGFEREIAKYLSDTYGESFIRAYWCICGREKSNTQRNLT